MLLLIHWMQIFCTILFELKSLIKDVSIHSVALFVLLLECALGQQQRPCAVKGVNRLLDPTTSMTSVSMSCPVDEGAGVDVPEQFNWVWLRLDNNMDTPITNNITSGNFHTPTAPSILKI